MTSPVGLKAWPKRRWLSGPLWPRLCGLSWPPLGPLQLAFSRPVLASLAAFGLTWPRLASQGGPWPRLACLKALPCPAAGVPTLRSHRPCRCFLRVALSHSKPEHRADRGLKGALGLAFDTPWASFGWPLGANLGSKAASQPSPAKPSPDQPSTWAKYQYGDGQKINR